MLLRAVVATLSIAATACVLPERSPKAVEALAQIAQAESRWRAASLDSYAMTVTVSEGLLVPTDFCVGQRFDVKSGRSRFVAIDGCAEPRRRTRKLATVPALFRLARQNVGTGAGSDVSFSFDPTLGYPLRFYSGVHELEDAYFAFEVVHFETKQQARRP